ncbi:ATP-binding protein [Nonomuraea sp. CA-143628]|uniref:ATP-binding protein n=1 Tax=Nonomuraea sp. CA-143628 TaxID=3239997 RepID=UPI003D8BCE24
MTGPLRHYDDPPKTPFTNAPHATWRREFPASAISVPEARDWAGSLLSAGIPPSFLDDALLLLSEVVTNAITHSDSAHALGGQVAVQITRIGTTVRVVVADAGSATTAPAVRAPTLDDDGGRGMWLVDLLAEEWGFHRDETGGSVWFRLAERD